MAKQIDLDATNRGNDLGFRLATAETRVADLEQALADIKDRRWAATRLIGETDAEAYQRVCIEKAALVEENRRLRGAMAAVIEAAVKLSNGLPDEGAPMSFDAFLVLVGNVTRAVAAMQESEGEG